ncbi:MAG: hypothetical protein HY865_05315 [Chloroflexi bacterium]|nr:hypothetical protein [Chloroflexota bacterium]
MKTFKFLIWGLLAVLVLTAFAPVAAPSKPALYSPVGNAVKVDPDNVTLRWYRSTPSPTTSPVADYDIEVSEGSAVDATGAFQTTVYTANEPSPVPLTSTISHLIPAGTLDYGTSYYWHVRANASTSSAWSAAAVFRVGVEPPTLIALAPPPAPDLLTLRPTFSWTPGAQNAGSYTIQISRDSGFSTVYRTATVLASAVPANEYTPTTDLLPNILFYWRVRANNSLLGASDWSTPSSFTSANPPSVPVLISPKSTTVSTTPVMKWKVVSLQAGETFGTYEIEIFDTNKNLDTATPVFTANDTLNDGTPSLALQDTTSYDVPLAANLLPTTTYYWRMKAYNGDGEYRTSSLYTFYTSIVGEVNAATMDPSEDLGNVPGLEGPAFATTKTIDGFTGTVHENANLLSLYPIFRWDPGALNAQTFTVQVASYASGSCNVADPEESKFKTLIIDATVDHSDPEYAANLAKYPNYILCWRVRGNHSTYGSSDWSDVQIFRTANPPGIPVPTAPVDGTLTNDNSPRLVWNKVTLPSGTIFGKYEVEISFNSTFSGYDYPVDTIPPFLDPIDPASYPLPSPILPDNTVNSPVYSPAPPAPVFPNIPMVDQAHNPTTDLANTREESWYDVEPDIVPGPPIGNPLYGAHTYYWRVRSYNEYGEYSAWSVVRSIKIMVDRPTGLVITDCAGTVITDAITPRPCFDWDDVYRANSYKISIGVQNTNGSVTKILTGVTGGSAYQPVVDLPKGKTIVWWVTTVENTRYGVSLPASGAPFQSARPPTTPIPRVPINSKLVLTDTPTFTWTRSSYPLGTNFGYYEIQVARDKYFAYPVEPTAQTAPGDDYELSYTIATALTPARTYYWRVRACNDEVPNECSTWSPVNYFRTSVAAPTLVVPPDTANPLRPIFEWDAVNDASSYTIWVSKNAACITPVASATTSALLYQPGSNLAAGTTYYWCVRANSASFGPGPWSTIDTFTTP